MEFNELKKIISGNKALDACVYSYAWLLVNLEGKPRCQNQEVLITLRDAIADTLGVYCKDIQESAESAAALSRHNIDHGYLNTFCEALSIALTK
jgi:hypothetical protein